MVQTASAVTPSEKVDSPLTKKQITVLQINLGAVTSPVRIATWKWGQNELKNSEICAQLIELIYKFPKSRLLTYWCP